MRNLDWEFAICVNGFVTTDLTQGPYTLSMSKAKYSAFDRIYSRVTVGHLRRRELFDCACIGYIRNTVAVKQAH